MGRRRTYDGDVYSGEAFYIMLYADVHRKQPVLFSSDAGRTFYTLNTPFQFVKGVVSKNGNILCVGLSGGRMRAYISRDQGRSFNEINFPHLQDGSKKIGLSITSDGSEAYLLDGSTLYRYKEDVQLLASYNSEWSDYRSDLMVSGDGRVFYIVLYADGKKTEVRTIISIDGGNEFGDLSNSPIINASRDSMFFGMTVAEEKTLILFAVEGDFHTGFRDWYLHNINQLYITPWMGNNKVAYYTHNYDLYAADFKTRETRRVMTTRELKDINAEGTIGVARVFTSSATPELVDLSKGEVIRSFEGATQYHIYAAIGK